MEYVSRRAREKVSLWLKSRGYGWESKDCEWTDRHPLHKNFLAFQMGLNLVDSKRDPVRSCPAVLAQGPAAYMPKSLAPIRVFGRHEGQDGWTLSDGPCNICFLCTREANDVGDGYHLSPADFVWQQ